MKSPKITTQMELITPEIAKKIILRNTSNRPLNKKTVDYYAYQMENGQWTTSGQTISISDDGVLIDGQHRLEAVIQSGVSVWLNVSRGVPIESFVNYDALRARGTRDVFAISRVANYSNVASIISSYAKIKANSIAHMGFSGTSSNAYASGRRKDIKVSNLDMLQLHDSNPELWQEIFKISQKLWTKIKLFSISQMGAIMGYLIIDLRHDKEKVFSFFEQLFLAEYISNNSIFNLRERLIRDMMSQYKMPSRNKYVFLVKCWNAYVQGKVIKSYVIRSNEIEPTFI